MDDALKPFVKTQIDYFAFMAKRRTAEDSLGLTLCAAQAPLERYHAITQLAAHWKENTDTLFALNVLEDKHFESFAVAESAAMPRDMREARFLEREVVITVLRELIDGVLKAHDRTAFIEHTLNEKRYANIYPLGDRATGRLIEALLYDEPFTDLGSNWQLVVSTVIKCLSGWSGTDHPIAGNVAAFEMARKLEVPNRADTVDIKPSLLSLIGHIKAWVPEALNTRTVTPVEARSCFEHAFVNWLLIDMAPRLKLNSPSEKEAVVSQAVVEEDPAIVTFPWHSGAQEQVMALIRELQQPSYWQRSSVLEAHFKLPQPGNLPGKLGESIAGFLFKPDNVVPAVWVELIKEIFAEYAQVRLGQFLDLGKRARASNLNLLLLKANELTILLLTRINMAAKTGSFMEALTRDWEGDVREKLAQAITDWFTLDVYPAWMTWSLKNKEQ